MPGRIVAAVALMLALVVTALAQPGGNVITPSSNPRNPTPDTVCLDSANLDTCLVRSAANIMKVATTAAGSTAATMYAAKFTTTGTGTFSGVTVGAAESVGILNGGRFAYNVPAAGTNALFFTSDTNHSNTTSASSTIIGQAGFAPGSGSGSYAMLHLNPTINGTSSGTAYGLGVASKTNTLTGGSVKLASFGTTTTDLFTGYTALVDVDTTGLTRSTLYGTVTRCANTGSPATCAAAPAGSVVIAAAATAVVVNTTAITANSQVFAMIDRSLGALLSVTCDTTSDLTTGSPAITARSAGTSFTIAVPVAPAANPMCLSYFIIN